MPECLRVDLGERSYDILVGEQLLASAGENIKSLMKSDFAIVVSDETAAKFYLPQLTAALEKAGIRWRSVVIPPGEASKTIPAFGELMENILAQRPDRKTMLIALGGGVVGDVTGFAASVLLRGVDFIQVPTTLLAQVDSSVGGKTGVNSSHGKNLIGSFHQPRLVLCDITTLSTLPERQKKAGYAEIVKYGLINDAAFFAWLEKNGSSVLACEAEALTEAVTKSCKAKAAIVVADEKEAGKRALLNFGHTFGHALEVETHYSDKLLHGEAVAIGMALAFAVSVKMEICPPADYERVRRHLHQTGLPSTPLTVRRDWDVERLMTHMAQDKKAESGKLTFILTHGIGKAFIASNVEKPLIKQALVEALSSV